MTKDAMLGNGQGSPVCGSGSWIQTWTIWGNNHINIHEKRFQAKRTASEKPLSWKVHYYPKNKEEDYVAEMDYRQE